ncbi:peptidase E [Sphingobium nicotianae]|uniref:Peptidase E n=1 Tax=Sphingobium nicotianae TaxID=2782607 RepID=A0A9X1D9G2_9SPHN|nr:peptidase E [Sphingobium nicotianae]MBT2185853.1 peptidase E [Sphingobium nicotianae]
MKRRDFLLSSVVGTAALATTGEAAKKIAAAAQPAAPMAPPNGKILIAGGRYDTKWIGHMARLTGKARPRILYLSTATGDQPNDIIRWFRMAAPLEVEAIYQPSFINSRDQQQSWEEALLSVDGIVCSGGNTLNQQAIWKAQGIDLIMRQAWEKGIVLGGASAGSLPWFEEGSTDSRPKELTIVKCLGFIKGSHSPHYDGEPLRRPLYHKLIGSGEMKPGFACDNDAGIYFEGDKPKQFLTARTGAKVYYVSAKDGVVTEQEMPVEPLV